MKTIKQKRVVIGIIGLVCILTWLGAFFVLGFEEVVKAKGFAIVLRVGLVFCAIWFAMPTLMPLLNRGSSLALGIALVFLAFIVAQPKIGRIAIILLIAGVSINWLLRVLSGKTTSQKSANESRESSLKP